MTNSHSEQNKTVQARFETARALLSAGTVEGAQQAIAELTPAMVRTRSISEFQTLAELLSTAYTITGDAELAQAWKQYAPAKPEPRRVEILDEMCVSVVDVRVMKHNRITSTSSS